MLKMIKFASNVLVGVNTVAVATMIQGEYGFSWFPAALIAAPVSAALWAMIGHLAAPIYRNDRDVLFMMHGRCPHCSKPGHLEEVTSTTDGVIVECTNCDHRFDVISSEGGPIVKRLGKA